MPKVSINILTKNRAVLLSRALDSVNNQSFKDFEIIVVDDASTDNTASLLKTANAIVIRQELSKGITFNRQLALEKSSGEYIAVLDDDDEWVDADKIKQQVEFLDSHPDFILVGGGIIINNNKGQKTNTKRFRPETDREIRETMLYRNNFFTSTVMFRKAAAIKAGGFVSDGVDLAEDYDLWLRLGLLGKMYNFRKVFTNYTQTSYNKLRFNEFLSKQLRLIYKVKSNYPGFWLASIALKIRLFF